MTLEDDEGDDSEGDTQEKADLSEEGSEPAATKTEKKKAKGDKPSASSKTSKKK